MPKSFTKKPNQTMFEYKAESKQMHSQISQ